jgi:hypothetical protein
VRHLGGSAGFGGDSERSISILETDMDLAAINAHYAALRFADTPRRHFLQVHVDRAPDR